jgi:hypothetical protein
MPSLATLHDDYALRGRIDEAAPVYGEHKLRAGHEKRLAALKSRVEGSA